MITLKELNEDPRFRQMTLEELTGVIHDMMGPVTKPPSKDWNDLPGDWSIDKAQNLLSKWAAEGKQGQMVCEWRPLHKTSDLYPVFTSCRVEVSHGMDMYKFCPYCGKSIKQMPEDK
jgi:hypothetical protein